MSFTTVHFFLFLLTGVVLYYIFPVKLRWIWLLVLSYYYYLSFGFDAVRFILAVTFITFTGGILLEKLTDYGEKYLSTNKAVLGKEERKAFKNRLKRGKKLVVAAILLAVFGILAVLKYTNFVLDNVSGIIRIFNQEYSAPHLNMIVPLGISFYTFMSAGYIFDIYNGKYRAEKNFFKYALFVSFFPQIMQGPIGRYDKLSAQLFSGNRFNLKNLQYGMQRVIWGLFKKMVIADRCAGFVTNVFNGYTKYNGGYFLIANLLYCAWLYADFSGGIDIVLGVAEMFGVKLDENFRQPFFSKSVGEFWRRWHITLGAWMKEYIFYPFTLCKGVGRLGKKCQSIMGKHMGKAIVVSLADMLIFLIVGIWHGAAWKYILYGVYNGLLLSGAVILEPVFEKAFRISHIDKNSRLWNCFRVIRTFVFVYTGFFFDKAVDAAAAFKMMWMTVTNLDLSIVTSTDFYSLGMKKEDFVIVILSCILLLAVSIAKERGVNIRDFIANRNIVLRWSIYYAIIIIIFIYGYTGSALTFLYANF